MSTPSTLTHSPRHSKVPTVPPEMKMLDIGDMKMSERVTQKDVQFRIDRINSIFEKHGKNTQWQMNGRYGYQAIDAGPADGYAGSSTIITGCTKSELYHMLGVALDALAVLGREPMPDKAERERKEAEREKAQSAWLERAKKLTENLKESGAEGMI